MDLKKLLEHPIIAAIIARGILGMISSSCKMYEKFIILNYKMDMIEEDIDKNHPNGPNYFDEHKNYDSDNEVMLLNLVPSLFNKEVITNSLSEINFFENGSNSIGTMRMQDPVAYNYDTQEEYTLDQLVGQKVLLCYENDDEDVFFCGEFDKEGYYIGECTTNIYENGSLKLITSANYLHGEMVSFVKVFPTKTKQGVDVWAIMDYVVEQEHNNGETRYYIRNSPYLQNFESENVTENDIISVEDFLENYDTILVVYYREYFKWAV